MYYILDRNNKPVRSTLEGYEKWCSNHTRFIVRTDISNDTIHTSIVISTVFMGLDHSYLRKKGEKPILFETMIFGGEHDQRQKRYTSYQDAVDGHKEMVEIAQGRTIKTKIEDLFKNILKITNDESKK